MTCAIVINLLIAIVLSYLIMWFKIVKMFNLMWIINNVLKLWWMEWMDRTMMIIKDVDKSKFIIYSLRNMIIWLLLIVEIKAKIKAKIKANKRWVKFGTWWQNSAHHNFLDLIKWRQVYGATIATRKQHVVSLSWN